MGSGDSSSRLPPGPQIGTCPISREVLLARPRPEQLVVPPAGAVDQQAGAVGQFVEHVGGELLHARQVDQRSGRAGVGDAVAHDSAVRRGPGAEPVRLSVGTSNAR